MRADLIIRNAVAEDVHALRDVFLRASLVNEDGSDLMAAHPEWFVWDDAMLPFARVAVVGERVVGFASARPAEGFFELEDLFTDPDWMRQGVASALVADIARRGLSIEVSANPLALGFYESAGFVAVGVAETEGGPVPRMRLDARPPAGSIREEGRYPIDLTGPGSHALFLERGVGSLSIGPSRLGKKADLHVAPDARIDWTVFDAFSTPAGSPWPRYLRYAGSDAGFFGWAQRRPIEEMTWTPLLPADMEADASRSNLNGLHLQIEPTGGRLSLKLPKGLNHLSVSGELSRFSATGDMPTSLTIAPHTGRRRSDPPFLVPDLGELHQVTSLALQNAPLGQPISLACLSRFPNLVSLRLWGNFCDLDLLARHNRLTSLELRFMPELEDLPSLQAWASLDSFIAYNVEEAAGKRLRQEITMRAKIRPWTGHASVSQLRKPEWWTTEFGRPFSSWPKRLAKLANEAYDLAQANLTQARSLAEAESIIAAFAARFNTLKGIETAEREDLGEAVWQLSQSDHRIGRPIAEEMARRWFDAARQY